MGPTLPPPEHRIVTDAPQFSLQALLLILTTCALAFAVLGAPTHFYLDISAVTVLVFWAGIAVSFLGLALNSQGDVWFVPATLAEACGLGLVLIAAFTGVFYGLLFALDSVVALL